MTRPVSTLIFAVTLCASLAAAQDATTSRPNSGSLTYEGAHAGASAQLPDAPSSVTREKPQRQELLADDPYRPLTDRQKFTHWVHRTYAPGTFVAAGVSTSYASANSDLRYGYGSNALARQYASNLADTETREFFGSFLFPTLLGQDPRYLPKRSGGVVGRALYAITRVLITRNDDGHQTFNSSEVLGVAFSRALSNAYYPEDQRTWSHTGNRIMSSVSGDVGGNLLAEFTPDLIRLFRDHAPRRLKGLGDRLGLSSTAAQY